MKQIINSNQYFEILRKSNNIHFIGLNDCQETLDKKYRFFEIRQIFNFFQYQQENETFICTFQKDDESFLMIGINKF